MKRWWRNSVRGAVTGSIMQAGQIHGNVYISSQDAAHEADPLLIVTTRTRQIGRTQANSSPDYYRHRFTRGVWIEILVQTRSAQAVVLHELRPVFIRRLPPEHRSIRPLGFPRETETSSVDVRRMSVDLDDPAPQPCSLDGSAFPFKVSIADPEMFRVTLGSNTAEAVTLELAWTCASRSGITTIDQDGMPFPVDIVNGLTEVKADHLDD